MVIAARASTVANITNLCWNLCFLLMINVMPANTNDNPPKINEAFLVGVKANANAIIEAMMLILIQ